MKAEKVLERYKEGQRNFCHVNLRGQSFKGEDLSEADFSEADIQGANFTNTILRGANFSHAQAGLQCYWIIGLLIISLVLAAIAGFSSAIASYFVVIFFLPPNIEEYTIFFGVFVLVGFTVVLIVTFFEGLNTSLWTIVIVAGTFSAAGAVIGPFVGLEIAAGAVMVVAAAFGALAVALAAAVARAGWMAATTLVVTTLTLTLASAMTGTMATVGIMFKASWVAASVVLASLYAYIGCRALAEQKRYAVVRSIAIAFAAIGGTSFRGADLTDADFTSTTLKSTDFRNATLTRTYWYQAKDLDLVRPGLTYLRGCLRSWLNGKKALSISCE